MAMTFQMLMRGVDGKTSCLRFSSRTLLGSLLHERIAAILRIPAGAFLIVTGTRVINPHSFLCASSDGFFPSCSLLLRLRGGKGGFGSLLRGAATKAGQKKTSNFDACRDMSGRRLRHVNAEKKLKEWKTQAKERELEKTANEFLKKQVKQKEDESGCSQVIERFREETFRAREDVESAVAQGLAEAKKLGKRKILDDCQPSTSSKRANIFDIDTDEEDSEDEREGFEDEDEDTDSDGSEVEDAEGSEDEDIEKGSEHENHKQSSEDDKAEQGSEVARVEGKFLDENAKVTSEDEQGKGGSECERDEETIKENHLCNGLDDGHVEKNMSIVEVTCSSVSVSVDVEFQKQHTYSCEERTEQGSDALPTRGENTCTKNGFHSESTNTASVNVETKDFLTVQATLNLGDYLHASDLEVLGLERLKQELQIRGLKCGGSLAERAGRLFLLKTVPLERLDKKHFAKARV